MTDPLVSPTSRNPGGAGFTAAAAEGRFALQACGHCGTVHYPPRELCTACLSDDLVWRDQDGAGSLLAHTVLHHTHDASFHARLPCRVGLVRLDEGPIVVVHLHEAVKRPPARVIVSARLDEAGRAVLHGAPQGEPAR